MANPAERSPAGGEQQPDDDDPAALDLDNDRIIGLSDGIFAFALTLMVLQFDVPSPEKVAAGSISREVLDQWPAFLSYALSFYIVAVFWVAHHRIYRYVRTHDERLVWLNILFLFCISFIPFPTDLMGEYPNDTFTVAFYALSMVATSSTLTLIWWYATRPSAGLASGVTPRLVRYQMLRGYGVGGVFLISAGVALISVDAARIFWLVQLPFQRLLAHAYRDALAKPRRR